MPAILRRRKAAPVDSAGVGGTAGWAPFGSGQHPSEQTGAYAGSLLNQYPAYWDEVQKWGGVVGLRSHWQVPTVSALPYWTQTTRPTNVPGAQKDGSTFTGPIGPLTSRRFMANVTAAQVRQSGAQAMDWAAQLSMQSPSD